MKKSSVVPFLFICIFIFSCKDKDDAKSPSKSQLLAGSAGKSWIITKLTPEDQDVDASCLLSSAHNADNLWIFSTSGSFTYDPGAIVDDPNCTSNCCSDFANLYGTWEIYDNDTKLKVHIIGRLDGGVKTPFATADQSDLLDATISSLTTTDLKIIEGDQTIEFTAK